MLDLLPPYFSQAIVNRDAAGSTRRAPPVIAFGIPVMPLDEQKALIDAIRAEIDPPGTDNDPPPGVSAEVVGLPVLAADANAALSTQPLLADRSPGSLAVALVLLAVYRSLAPGARAADPDRARDRLVGARPRGDRGIPLNPMSATLGALVIAIATEFSVILSARYDEERDAGRSVGEALRRDLRADRHRRSLASGVTAIAGFAVARPRPTSAMLRDFGLVTVVDLARRPAGVMLVLPAALVWAESGLRAVAGSRGARAGGRARRSRPPSTGRG